MGSLTRNWLYLFGATLLLGSLFFIALPRMQKPLFDIGRAKAKATTGFTENIRLGAFSEIQESSEIVFRVTFEGGKIFPPERLYFRVIVFDTFDGSLWSRREFEIKGWESKPYRRRKGIWGAVYLARDLEGYLPSLYELVTVKENREIERFVDEVLRWREVEGAPSKYALYLQRDKPWTIEEELSERKKKFYLQTPRLSPAIKELAKKLKGNSPEETLENILSYFQRERFRYTLRGLPLGENSLDEFLFKAKRGNCEYFATATALLLRLNGIPARVIGGYRGALYQERGKYYLVRQDFAHSWVEAWIGGTWKVIDPTPTSSLILLQAEETIFGKLKLLWDTVDFYYTKFIVDYDLDKQKRLFFTLKKALTLREKKKYFESREIFRLKLPPEIKLGLVFLLFLILFLAVIWLLKERKLFFLSPEKRVLKEFLKYLERRGYVRKESEGLFELVERIQEGELKEKSLEFVKIYSQYYYRDKPIEKEGLMELRRCLKAIQDLKLKK